MNKLKYWLRWIAVIPGAFFAAYIINYLLLGIILIFINPEKADVFLNIFLFPFTFTMASIYVGTKIAPAPKIKSLYILLALIILLEIPLAFISLSDDKIVEMVLPTTNYILRLIMAVAGAITGFYIAKKAIKTNN